ncbi:quinone oxidoreductase [Eurytemora carolleeae]|uniref:quinone oxidoreductase n=1 Tax=Eurytemora carolleeae TaxID=1294199 RepID=UPI000C75F5CB|nr:quinone oxidoreductase [Eurytemora carolleeae]|eukprot:XP_023340645.1 quinone oxidoreductase-like [Eurytemora affinis]
MNTCFEKMFISSTLVSKYGFKALTIRCMFTGQKIVVNNVSSDPVEGVKNLKIVKQEIRDTDIPDDAVLVKVDSCAVHWVDLLMFAGQYQQAPPLPYTPGMEYSGTVAFLPKGLDSVLSIGDKVYVGDIVNTGPRSYGEYAAWGGMASYSLAPSFSVRKLPAGLGLGEAAVLNGAYETAYHGLVHCGGLKKGELALIHGATGASGLAAVQLASALGADIIISGGSQAKLDLVEQQCYGTGRVVGKFNYNEEIRLDKYIKSLGFKGVDLVYDTVGGTQLARDSLKSIRFGGRYCVIGWTSTPLAGGGRGAGADHASANMIPTNLIMMKGAQIIGCPVAINTRLDPNIRIPRLQAIDDWLETGKIKPFISHTFPFNQFREALLAKWERKITGNCIVRCSEKLT